MTSQADGGGGAPTIIVLSSDFVQELPPGGLDALVDQIVDVARGVGDRPVDEVSADLGKRLDAHGLSVPEVVVNRLAETMASSVTGSIAITLDDNTVLYGDPDLGGAHSAHQEPEHVDRPWFT